MEHQKAPPGMVLKLRAGLKRLVKKYLEGIRSDDFPVRCQTFLDLYRIGLDFLPALAWGLRTSKSEAFRLDLIEVVAAIGPAARPLVLRILKERFGDESQAVQKKAIVALMSPQVWPDIKLFTGPGAVDNPMTLDELLDEIFAYAPKGKRDPGSVSRNDHAGQAGADGTDRLTRARKKKRKRSSPIQNLSARTKTIPSGGVSDNSTSGRPGSGRTSS